jgi:hypothetical protein
VQRPAPVDQRAQLDAVVRAQLAVLVLLVTSSETMSFTSPVRPGSSGSASTARRARTMDAACGGSRWVASWSGTCGMQRRRAADLAVK